MGEVAALPYQIKRSDDELYHSGILGMRWGIRRYQNKDGSLTEEGKKRYSDNASGYANAVKDNAKYDKAKLSKYISENTGLANAASSFKEDRKALHDATERERQEYSKLFANKKLLAKMSEQAFKEFYPDGSLTDEDRKKEKEYWDSAVQYASGHNGQTHEQYVTDSIIDAYYRSSEGKAYQKAVNDYVDAAVTAKRKADKLAKEYLQDHFDEPSDPHWANGTVGRDFVDRMMINIEKAASDENTKWDHPTNMIPDSLYKTLTTEQEQALYWMS